MTTAVNHGLLLQVTCLLVNPHTCHLNQMGVSRISLPSLWGRGRGRGQLGLLVCFVVLYFFFLQQALSKYCVLYILLVLEDETGNNGTEQGC